MTDPEELKSFDIFMPPNYWRDRAATQRWADRPNRHAYCDAEIARLRAESEARQALLNDTYAEKCALLEAVRAAWTDAYREKQRHQASEAAAERQRAWLERRVDALEKAVRAKHTELINLRGEQT